MAENLETNLEEGLPTENEPVQENQPQEQNTQETPQQKQEKKEYISRKSRENEFSEKVLKQMEWLRSQQDRKFNELSKKFDAVNPLVESYSQFQKRQKEAELAKLSKENPQEYQKQLIEQAKQDLMAGLQPQQTQETQGPSAEEHIAHLEQTYGREVLEPMAPIMGKILEETLKTDGPEITKQLAAHPDALMNMAIGQAYMEQYRGLQAAQQQGVRNQQRAQNFAKGTAKPSSAPVNKTTDYSNMSDEQLKKAAYAEIAKRHGL